MSELDRLRDEIRSIDEQMLDLVRRRNDTAKRIGALKRNQKLPLQNFEVEKAVLDHALAEARRLGVHEETATGLVRLLIQAALRAQERDAAVVAPKTGHAALIIGGAGLMGEWFARFLEEQGYEVFVDDPRPGKRPRAKLGDREWDLVLVSTPPSTIPHVLEEAATVSGTRALVVDIGSVKGGAVDVLHRLARAGKRVASLHPMFGPSTDLLMGKNVLVLDAGDATAAKDAARLFEHTAARTLPLKLEDHDAYMADVLTLSHATSLAFNRALALGDHKMSDLEPFASTTFRKQVDVSREVAHENPQLYFEIQAFNPASGHALARLEEAARDLHAVVSRKDQEAFTRYMQAGRAFYGGGLR